ncbi:MAG: hypothetical protein KJO36_06120 [Acidimicrobiia bacterium]|nr:hypothetical protein [Acidimicrobiia bacterium]
MASTQPTFASSVVHAVGQVSTANANRDGTGTITTVYTVDNSGGAIVDLVRVVATGTTTAGMVRIYLNDGSNTRMVKEITVDAVTASGTVPADSSAWVPIGDLILEDAHSIRASTENAEEFNVFVFGRLL